MKENLRMLLTYAYWIIQMGYKIYRHQMCISESFYLKAPPEAARDLVAIKKGIVWTE